MPLVQKTGVHLVGGFGVLWALGRHSLLALRLDDSGACLVDHLRVLAACRVDI